MLKKIFVILILFFIIFIPNSNQAEAEGYHIRLEGEINNALYSFIDQSLNQAESQNADFMIIEINSLGGYVNPALKIRDRIFNSPLKIITFVNGRAWSAAALIALTGDELYIAPGSSIGAAETRPNEEKYISALRKEFAATAERKGRNTELAEAMVDADIAVEDIIDKGKLLTLTAEEAVKYNIANNIAVNLGEVQKLSGISDIEIIEIEKTNLQILTSILTNPYISGLILVVAFSGLIFEALTPGFGLGGSIGIAALLLFFGGHILTGSLGIGMLFLFLIGILLILLEVFIIPGFGIAGISGITAVLVSLFFVFPNRTVALNVLLAVVFLTLLSGFIMIKIFGTSRFWRKISLDTDSKEYFSSSNKKNYVGRTALTLTKLRPAGMIDIDGRRVDAVSEGDFIEKDKQVKVISAAGNRVVVRKIEEED